VSTFFLQLLQICAFCSLFEQNSATFSMHFNTNRPSIPQTSPLFSSTYGIHGPVKVCTGYAFTPLLAAGVTEIDTD